MKITAIDPILVALPYDHGAPKPLQGTGVRTHLDSLFVRVETDAGVTGWGEAFSNAAGPVTVTALKRAVAPLAIGRDMDDIPALMTDLAHRLQSMTRNGPGAYALSGLDIALWDIKGKVEGKPIHALLGGKRRSRVEAYASLMRLVEPSHVKRVCGMAIERGYRHIKLHEHTVPAVAAAREAIGPGVSLMVDVNCHWRTADEAIAYAHKFAPYDIAWFEEPVYPPDDFESIARVRREGKLPVAAGENLGNLYDVRHMVDAGAVDYVQPSIAKMGGITEMMKAVAYAESKGVRGVPHAPYVGLGLIASLHVMAVLEKEVLCEHRNCDLEASPIGDWVVAQGGFLRVPDGPGLGVEPDLALLDRYRVD